MSPVSATSIARLETAYDGGHLGYAATAWDRGVLADVVARLGGPPHHYGSARFLADDAHTAWIWWPRAGAPLAWTWEPALPYSERIMARIAEAVFAAVISPLLNPRPEDMAAAVRADVYGRIIVSGVGNPGRESD